MSPVVLFDGECNLCHAGVQFILKRDKQGKVRFASLQSDVAKQLLEKFQLPKDGLDSMILVEADHIYVRSSAALRICRYLDGAWKLLYGLLILPPFIRDGLYSWVARHRYAWFGKAQTCFLPQPGLQSRFLG